jgi:hypothetical protein
MMIRSYEEEEEEKKEEEEEEMFTPAYHWLWQMNE